MGNIYSPWRFTESPFNSNPLPASDIGVQLLVGRDDEVAQIIRRLSTPPNCVTVEGPNGIGKTSIVNVAAYTELRRFQRRETDELLLPCGRTFQLEERLSIDDFVDEVYFAVARTIASHPEEVQRRASSLVDLTSMKVWLNSPRLTGIQAGFSFAGLGISGGQQAEQNTSPGFSRSGFQSLVRQWLIEIFSNGRSGGLVCILDNLELLQESKTARDRMEELRDRLLTVPGLRWVLCGAGGIVNSLLSTPRLRRVLYEPIEITGLSADIASKIWETRIAAYAAPGEKAPYMPLAQQGFETLVQIFRGNLGEAFAEANSYCMYVADQKRRPKHSEEMDAFFNDWLNARCRKLLQDINGHLTKRGWEVFLRAVEIGGSFSPEDHARFGCESPQALSSYVKALSDVDLIISTIDTTDRRRKTHHVTAQGWLVAYAKAKAVPPRPADEPD